ncbi:hypothetical protein M513_04545 [Trichuris suis]|uniref:Uncharacterized protein n=1 Tax=Trichuris suis TaxID=68888 RepID=A0A085MBK4_9BILA|nr:hypothetical protein M513_04545 [Trichuris suis]
MGSETIMRPAMNQSLCASWSEKCRFLSGKRPSYSALTQKHARYPVLRLATTKPKYRPDV